MIMILISSGSRDTFSTPPGPPPKSSGRSRTAYVPLSNVRRPCCEARQVQAQPDRRISFSRLGASTLLSAEGSKGDLTEQRLDFIYQNSYNRGGSTTPSTRTTSKGI